MEVCNFKKQYHSVFQHPQMVESEPNFGEKAVFLFLISVLFNLLFLDPTCFSDPDSSVFSSSMTAMAVLSCYEHDSELS